MTMDISNFGKSNQSDAVPYRKEARKSMILWSSCHGTLELAFGSG
jgi:hypothetical protein